MNDYFLSIILGIIEGLTEFLPVSSTAHLRIAEALLKVDLGDGYWKMFSIVIQLGVILCLPIYFRKRIAEFLSTFPRGVRGDRTILTHPLGLTIAPSGHILTVNGNDGNLVEVTPHGRQVETVTLDSTGNPPGSGTLFGLAVAPEGVYFVDDGSNTLNLLADDD